MSVSDSEQLNQGLQGTKNVAEDGARAGVNGASKGVKAIKRSVKNTGTSARAAGNAAKATRRGVSAAARGAKAAAKGVGELGKGIGELSSNPVGWIIIAVIILLIFLLVIMANLDESSYKDTDRRTAVGEEDSYNYPESEEDKEASLYDESLPRENTIALVRHIHEVKEKDYRKIDAYAKLEIAKAAIKAGLTPEENVDAELSLKMAKNEAAESSGNVYLTAGSGTLTSDDTINILMVDDDDENKRVADRFESLGCKVTIVFDDASIDPDKYDALVIPGGHNVSPSLYGEKKSKNTSGTNLKKDKLQIKAVKAFTEKGKPILGLCRGMQLINVSFGGTIDQGDGTYHKEWHNVNFEKGSWFYEIYGKKLKAWHYHKQQVKDVAPGFKVTTWSKKGTKKKGYIEGIEHETLPIYCTQWHPDANDMLDKGGMKTFEAFEEVIKSHKGVSTTTSDSTTSTGSTPSTKYKAKNPAIQGAINWAVMIANDDTFNYGTKPYASKPGCYFCGTNGSKVRAAKAAGLKNPKRFEKTYVCVTFVQAAFAHGANDPTLLKKCKKGRCCIYESDATWKDYKKVWKFVGRCKELSFDDLQPGDVFIKVSPTCAYRSSDGNGHACLYLGENDVAEATGGTFKKSSIRVKGDAKQRFKGLQRGGKNYVIRYIGNGSGTGGYSVDTVDSLETYDKITTLKTLGENTGKKVIVKTTKGYATQSFAYNDGFFYVQSVPRGASGRNGYITKINADGKEVSKSEKLNINHGNGLAYNDDDGRLYSVTTNHVGDNKKITIIDIDSLAVATTKSLEHGTSSVAYDRATGRFITSSGAQNGKASSAGHLYVYEKDLSKKTGAKDITKLRWATPGDIAAYNGIVYCTISGGDQVFGTNHIDMYNENTGKYLGSYDVPYGEIEGIDFDSNGQMVLLIHGQEGDFLQFTGITALGGTAESNSGPVTVTELDMDILSAYNITLANTALYMDPESVNEAGDSGGWLDEHGYADIAGKKVPVFWFGKNRGMINYEKDFLKKIDSWFKGNPVEHVDNGTITVDKPDSSEWNLLLVNNDNAVPNGYSPKLTTIDASYISSGDSSDKWRNRVDSRIYENLKKMLDDCKAAGYDPLICSAYRTRDMQQELYDNTANKADTAVPGHSEHECGLSVDIVDSSYQTLDDKQAETGAQKWLMEHCWEYGFILRYPKGKQDITGIIWEPWHYRYVGKEHAKVIMDNNGTLEEYLNGEFKGSNTAEEPSTSKHFFKVVVGTSPEPVNSTDSDGKTVTKYILPVTIKESEIEDFMEPVFGLNPAEDYINSMTIKGARDASSGNADSEDDKPASTGDGTATNLDATYSLSDTTGRWVFGEPTVVQNPDFLYGNDSDSIIGSVTVNTEMQQKILNGIATQWPANHSPWDNGYAHLCEKWVCDVYKAAGLPTNGSCCAAHSRDKTATKEGDIPPGAMIYSGPSYHSTVHCEVCGRNAGHVAIYIGNGKVAGSQVPYIMSLDRWTKMFGYGGWSFSGNTLG